MPSKNRFLLGSLIVLLAGLLLVFFSPVLVATGVRAWIWWKARQEKLTVKIDKIEAPFLRPLVMHGVHVSSAPDAAFRIEMTAARAALSLNLRTIIWRTHGQSIQALAVEDLRGEVHRNHPGTSISKRGWGTLQNLVPKNFSLERCDFRMEDGATIILLRAATLTGSQIESGRFQANEFVISSPWLRQTFSDLRGATTWQEDKLTMAGLTLVRGLDVQAVTVDLSRLGEQSVSLDFDIDAFGGKIRASISNEWRAHHPNWNLVGSASDISLTQTSGAFGFMDRVGGLLHACKFTFRGDVRDPTHAIASLWTELTGLTWRNRSAQTIMLGAVLYNRQIQLQQLFVKQSNNQLTLSGETALPTNSFDWLNPDFRGNILASIGNLGDFAGLFGADPGQFGGEITIEGTMDTRDRKIGGHLIASGKSLSVFKTPIDSFAAKVGVKASELEVEQLEMKRQSDSISAQGKVNFRPEHDYSGTAKFTAENIAPYLHLLPFSWSAALAGGAVNCDWSGNGKTKSHSGTVHVNGRGIQVACRMQPLPFSADLEAVYAPGSLFFRQAHLANEHASINGFVTIASTYLQLQAVALDVNGKPKLRGNMFLPIAISKALNGTGLADALDQGQKVDVDLAIDPTDLAEVSEAVLGRHVASGTLAGRLSIFGEFDSLQGWSEMHLRDFALPDDASRASADVQSRFASGTMNSKASFQLRGSAPLSVEASLPVRLGEQRKTATTEPMSGMVDFQKISMGQLPRYLSRDLLRDGILTGKLTLSGTADHPNLIGQVQLTGGKLGTTPVKATDISGRLNFQSNTATIDPLQIATKDVELSFGGKIDFANGTPSISLVGNRPLFDLSPADAVSPTKEGELRCASGITLRSVSGQENPTARVDEINFFRDEKRKRWTWALHHRTGGTPARPPTDKVDLFSICSGGETNHTELILASESPPKAPGPRKRPRHR